MLYQHRLNLVNKQFKLRNNFVQGRKHYLFPEDVDNYKHIEITAIWYGNLLSNDFQILHDHSLYPSFDSYSGSIYLDVPKNLPFPQGCLNFILGGAQSSDKYPYWTVSPKTGDAFIWPSWLIHDTHPFFKDGHERLMISFNAEMICHTEAKSIYE